MAAKTLNSEFDELISRQGGKRLADVTRVLLSTEASCARGHPWKVSLMDLRKGKSCTQCQTLPKNIVKDVLTELGVTAEEVDGVLVFERGSKERLIFQDSPSVFIRDGPDQKRIKEQDEDLLSQGKYIIHLDYNVIIDRERLRPILTACIDDESGVCFSDEDLYGWYFAEESPLLPPPPVVVVKPVVAAPPPVATISPADIPEPEPRLVPYKGALVNLADDEVEGKEDPESLRPGATIEPRTSLVPPGWVVHRLGPRSFVFLNQETRMQHHTHTAVGYCRCSRPSQVNSTSLLNQEAIIMGLAKNHKVYLRAVYSDQGISGARLVKREAMHQLLRDFQHGEYLLTLAIHRLGRTKDDLMAIKKKAVVENYGVIVSQEVTIRLNDPSSSMFFDFLANMSQMERETISKRVRASIDYQVRTGTRKFKPKFGWRNPGPGLPLVEVPEEQQIIEIIRQMRADGQSDNNIALQLTASHGDRGYTFNYSKINRIRHQNDIK